MVIMKKLGRDEDLTAKIKKQYFQMVCLNDQNRQPKDKYSKFLERDEKRLLYEKTVIMAHLIDKTVSISRN